MRVSAFKRDDVDATLPERGSQPNEHVVAHERQLVPDTWCGVDVVVWCECGDDSVVVVMVWWW